jgi:hypothetical protein
MIRKVKLMDDDTGMGTSLLTKLTMERCELVQRGFLDQTDCNLMLSTLRAAVDHHAECLLSMPDGYFFPHPYSTVHGAETDPEAFLEGYFSMAAIANSLSLPNAGNIADLLRKKVECVLGRPLNALSYNETHTFAKFGLRVLLAGKNGIDIHCENAFLHQLRPDMSSWLKAHVDIERAISFFTILQAPEVGGELVLFNKTWDEFSVKLDESTYEERHDLKGSLFTNRGAAMPTRHPYRPEQGQAVLFPAAQIWHCINRIGGGTDRVTIGFFVAEGKDGNHYFWA